MTTSCTTRTQCKEVTKVQINHAILRTQRGCIFVHVCVCATSQNKRELKINGSCNSYVILFEMCRRSHV